MDSINNSSETMHEHQHGTLYLEINRDYCPENSSLITDSMIHNAVSRACAFFGMPEIPTHDADGTLVWTNNPADLSDDVFGINRQELMKMGINGEDSLTLIYTHECAHRALQHKNTLNSWEEELACDYFSGLHAGMHNIDISKFEAALGETQGGETHPSGALRAIFIEEGKRVAENMNSKKIEITFDNSFDSFLSFLEEKGNLVTEYMNHDIPDNSETEETHDLKSKHSWIDDRKWHMDEAKKADEEANYHQKEASKAAGRGDYSKAKDHERTAQSYRQKAADHRKSASQCSK